jgi:hypothetical protein
MTYEVVFVSACSPMLIIFNPGKAQGIDMFPNNKMRLRYRQIEPSLMVLSHCPQVSGTIRASGEEAPWALRPIFEAVFISECVRIADSILKTAAPLLQSYVAKRDKVRIISRWQNETRYPLYPGGIAVRLNLA